VDLFSIWHWLIVGAVVLLVFGGHGKISDIMGDVAKGIKAFKSGMADTAEAHAAFDRPSDAVSAQDEDSDRQGARSANKD
jgi:sec-independent protein translocase protein TatA